MVPAAAVTTALAVGIVLGRLRNLSITGLGAGVILLFLWAVYRSWRDSSLPIRELFLLVVAAGIMISMAAWQETMKAKSWSAGPVWQGTVMETARFSRDSTRLTVQSLAGRVRVVLAGVHPDLLPGDTLCFHQEPSLPRESSNPGEFDYRFYLALRRIPWVLHVRLEDPWQKISSGKPGLKRLGAGLSLKFRDIYGVTLAPDQAALLSSLVLGQRDELEQEVESGFQKTGLGHLLAVSGFHVGYAVLLVGLMGKFLGLKNNFLYLWQGAGVWIFAAAAGLQTGVVRAAVMVTLGLGARMWSRHPHPAASLGIAALCLLIFQPLLLFDPGFQLSFAATAGILFGLPLTAQMASGIRGWIIRSVALSVLIQAAVLPLTAYHFNRMVWTVPLTQLLVAPLVGLAVLLGLAAGWGGLLFLPAARILNLANGLVLSGLQTLVQWLATLPGHGWNVPSPPVVLILLWYILLLLFWQQDFSRGRQVYRRRTVGMMLTVLLGVSILWHSWIPFWEPVRVTFLDVGQGDAILIQTRTGQTLLVDGGNRLELDTGTIDQGARVVLPFLRQAGVNRLDVLYTHAHDDHLGGLIAVAEAGLIRNLWAPALAGDTNHYHRLLKTLSELGRSRNILRTGDTLHLGPDVQIHVLSPPAAGIPGAGPDLNNHSLVLMLTTKNQRLLLTGDLEKEGIRWLTAHQLDLSADILKVPHHGSSSSFDPDFYRAVSPKAAIITVGANRFGHPGSDVLQYFSAKGFHLYRTDQDGAVRVQLYPRRIQIETFRNRKKVWH